MNAEGAVALLAKWYEIRRFTMQHYGVSYTGLVRDARRTLRARMVATGEDSIHAAMALFAEADAAGHGIEAGLYVSALLEEDGGGR